MYAPDAKSKMFVFAEVEEEAECGVLISVFNT